MKRQGGSETFFVEIRDIKYLFQWFEVVCRFSKKNNFVKRFCLLICFEWLQNRWAVNGRRILLAESLNISMILLKYPPRFLRIIQDWKDSSLVDIYFLPAAHFLIHFLLGSQVFMFLHCSFFASSSFCPRCPARNRTQMIYLFSLFQLGRLQRWETWIYLRGFAPTEWKNTMKIFFLNLIKMKTNWKSLWF